MNGLNDHGFGEGLGLYRAANRKVCWAHSGRVQNHRVQAEINPDETYNVRLRLKRVADRRRLNATVAIKWGQQPLKNFSKYLKVNATMVVVLVWKRYDQNSISKGRVGRGRVLFPSVVAPNGEGVRRARARHA